PPPGRRFPFPSQGKAGISGTFGVCQRFDVALYRDRLYELVWNEPFSGETRTLDSHIQRLRKKLGWEEHIKTVFRIGYRLEV
ncbi:MAG: winged helix-turn-helix domain-containing protein, partial [Clostridia bacterium]|nr:winged helix-turn-helix domain-containing protein [Clostridia bacterium]